MSGEDKSFGQVAYEAFHAPAAPPRGWEKLNDRVRERWTFIAKAIVEHSMKSRT